MALRVLLADESSTIKKVMQLALQDFAVEVKAVHVGLDVLEVARAFKPDVIFVDVLLQKKNGYEVCAELKGEASTRHTPTVLMWSSFMELDQDQLAKAQPTAKIEKPFDVETLRKLVLSVVPETRSQRLSHFLEFPETVNESAQAEANPSEAATKAASRTAIPMPPPIQNSRANFSVPQDTMPVPVPPPTPGGGTKSNVAIPAQAPKAAPTPAAPEAKATKDSWTMESFDDINDFAANEPAPSGDDLAIEANADVDEDFQPMNLSKSQAQVPTDLSLEPVNEPAVEEAWAHKDLSRFKVDLPPVSVDEGGVDLQIDMAEDEFTSSGFLYRPEQGRAVVVDEPQPPPEALELDPTMEEPELEERTQPVLEVEDNTARLQLEREEVAQPLEPMEVRASGTQGNYRPSWAPRDTADIPQLSADRIEEIIRAQSRDIIEEVVRRVVPDIATELIREELDRLLEETSVRETRRREPRP